jgi:hypothetical protein
MLKLIIEQTEHYDEETKTFVMLGGRTIELEHSLLSLSKWESKHQKPFLDKEAKTPDEILDYIRCMILSPDDSQDFVKTLQQVHLDAINDYINSKESATTFGIMPENKSRGETITSELIYYWMVAFNIPFEVETWHINRLFSLIRICNIKNSKPKKMSRQEIAQQNRELNEKRRKELGTSG